MTPPACARAADLLSSELAELHELWKNRYRNKATPGWAGFGVTLDLTEPQIIHFIAGQNVPDCILTAPLGGRTPAFVTGVHFRSIPPRQTFAPGWTTLAAHPGCNITGSADSGAIMEGGTIGAFLVESGKSGRWALSANHVIAFNGAYPDLEVTIPIGPFLTLDQPVAVKVLNGSDNLVDAAIVRVSPATSINPRIPGLPLTSVESVTTPSANASVKKVGWSSPNPVPGRLAYFARLMEITLDRGTLGDALYYELADQWIIEGDADFAAPGDSGALAVIQSGTETLPFGLLVAVQSEPSAAGKSLSVVTPLATILAELKRVTGKTFMLDPASIG